MLFFIYLLQLHPLELEVRAKGPQEHKQACFYVAFNSYLLGSRALLVTKAKLNAAEQGYILSSWSAWDTLPTANVFNYMSRNAFLCF